MSRRSWGILVLVLVCVVALVTIARVAYQSNADKSVEDAARYYADAIAEGRVEDALKVEVGDSFGDATKNADHAVDLRGAVASEPVWVKEIRVHNQPDLHGRQGAVIEFKVGENSVNREIYLDRVKEPLKSVGYWRVVSSAARAVRVDTEGYGRDVTIGGVSIGPLGRTAYDENKAKYLPANYLWYRAGQEVTVYAYPGIYDVAVDTASEHVRLTVDQATAKTTMDLGKDVEKHGIKAVATTDAVLWLKHNAEGYLTECLQGGNPDRTICPSERLSGVQQVSIGSMAGSYPTGIRLSDVVVRTSSEERTLQLTGEVVFDPSNDLHMLLKPL